MIHVAVLLVLVVLVLVVLVTVTVVAAAVPVAPLASVAVAVHWTASSGLTSSGVSVSVLSSVPGLRPSPSLVLFQV